MNAGIVMRESKNENGRIGALLEDIEAAQEQMEKALSSLFNTLKPVVVDPELLERPQDMAPNQDQESSEYSAYARSLQRILTKIRLDRDRITAIDSRLEI